MSAEQDWGADTTTQGPPRSYRREGASIISSSQLSPKSPAPWDDDRGNRSERNSWGEAGDERIDRRRRSTVTFGGATSVAPSDSISKVKSRSGRGSGDASAPGTQYSRRSRRRSAPWQDHDYRSTYPSKAGSSQGGTQGGAPLTEGNLEELNEKRPPRTDDDVGKELGRDVEAEQLDRKSSRKSRRDSGTTTQQSETRVGWIGADDRRTSRQYSRVDRDSAAAPAERTVVTTRRKTEVEEDSPDDEEVETKSKSRYESHNRAARSSTSKLSERRKSRAADIYAQASQRRSSSAAGSQTQKPRTSFTQRSRPPTMPAESVDDARSSRDVTVVAADTTAGSRPDSKSRARTAYIEESNEEETRQSEAKSFSSRQDEGRTRQREVRSERISEREEDNERKSASPPSRVSGRQSQAPTRPSQAAAGTAAAAPTSPTSPSSGPSSPTSATSPTAPEGHWERHVHIVETRKPDGRVITDREYTMRRIRPQQEQQVEA